MKIGDTFKITQYGLNHGLGPSRWIIDTFEIIKIEEVPHAIIYTGRNLRDGKYIRCYEPDMIIDEKLNLPEWF